MNVSIRATRLVLLFAAAMSMRDIAAQPEVFQPLADRARRAVELRAALERKDFAQLEAIFAKVRVEGKDPIQGESFFAYLALADVPEPKRSDLVRAWIAARPASATARLALADAVYEHAWAIRGTGFNNTVGEAARREYGRKLREAQQLLEDARRAGAKDAKYWDLLILITNETGEGDVRDVVRRAARSTTDPLIYVTAAQRLIERWSGSFELLEPFAGEAAGMARPKLGADGMYFVIARVVRKLTAAEEFAKYGFDQQRIRTGCVDLLNASPKWIPSYHRCAWLASAIGDRPLARGMFRKPQLDWYEGAEDLWVSRKAYERARNWASGGDR
jgi:hypothetical protein